MANSFFQFKQFTIHQDKGAMKVTTDGCVFGAWIAAKARNEGFNIKHCLDIGTGTGLLSLMLAQQSGAEINTIEIDKDAFEQASSNVAASPWHSRVKVLQGDARAFAFPGKYDFIMSNPPFYENELKGDDARKNIAHHSEDLSLTELLSVIKQNLAPHGIFCLLLPYKRNDVIKKMLLEKDLAILQMVFVRQSVKHDYFRIILSGSLDTEKQAETLIDEIAIWDDKQQYTNEFTHLLEDYYLKL